MPAPGLAKRRLRTVLALVAGTLAVALPTGVARGDTTHPRTIVFNRSISSVRLGESRPEVTHAWGKGKRVSGLIMEESVKKLVGGVYRYVVPHGNLEVGFYQGRVVDVGTNSSYYKTKDGIGVGSRIAYAKRVTLDGDNFRYFYTGYHYAALETWTHGHPAYPKKARKPNQAFERWIARLRRTHGTWLTVHSGVVTYVDLMRGDLCADCGA